MESEVDKSYSESTLLQTQQLQRRPQNAHDHAIAQREREINEIAQGIIELADIFRDLQAMVIDQGTMLDRIDYNVEKMGHEVKGAEKELVIVCCTLTIYHYDLPKPDRTNMKITRQQTTNAEAQNAK